MMKINFLTKQIAEQCHANLNTIFNEVILHKRQTLGELFHDDHLLHNMNLEMKELKLVRSEEVKRRNSTDTENAKIMYESMQNLTDSQASEENLWLAYTLILQRDYVTWRWQPKSPQDFKSHFLFGFGNSMHRSIFRNGMARLWWIARVTVDSEFADPYTLTRYVCSNTDIIQSILEQPVFQAPNVLHGTIRAMYDLEQLDRQEAERNVPAAVKYGVHIKKEDIQKTGQYMNMKAGTYLLDILTEQEIHDMVQRFIQKRHGIPAKP